MPETPSTIEHDIKELERQLEAKKSALEHEKSEKDVLHGILGEKIQQHEPQYKDQLPTPQASAPMTTAPLNYLSQEIKDKIQTMVDIVFSKSLDEGIKEAVKTGNIAIIDAFHDVLTDEFYDQLVERKKLEKI